jgi:mRNA-degrading endonuclease RelE of RelBE toxin-antitoxin system
MNYTIEFKPRALKDLHPLPNRTAERTLEKLDALRNDSAGDAYT